MSNKKHILEEDGICPKTGVHCDDRDFVQNPGTVGSECNIGEDGILADCVPESSEQTQFSWFEILQKLNLIDREIKVTLIKPVRTKDADDYKSGKLIGFKAGLNGVVNYNYKNGIPMSFNSSRIHQIKPIMVHVEYPVFEFQGKCYSDWVPIDNCTFEIVGKNCSLNQFKIKV
jgi:hypothetical protein